ncbi:hypothetical protein QUW44_08820, partial [Limosilactobacillus pontis]
LLTEFIVISIGDLKLKIYTCCYSVLTDFFMEEKHDIVAPVFKAKGKPVSKAKISSRPVVKMKAGNIQLTIFKGTNPSLAAEIVKAVVHYAH